MIGILLATGFEEIEAVTVIDLLRRAEIKVAVISIEDSLEVKGAHGISLKADQNLKDIAYENLSGLVLPGGMPGTKNLLESKAVLDLLNWTNHRNLLISAICAAPMVLGEHGFLKNQKATCYPGFEAHLKACTYVDEKVVESNNFITSKGPGTAIDFALALIKKIKGESVSKQIEDGLCRI